jgi:hypothetical protein
MPIQMDGKSRKPKMDGVMKTGFRNMLLFFVSGIVLASCSTLEKASVHGLNSGYYSFQSEDGNRRNVYLDVTEEKMDLYARTEGRPEGTPFRTIPTSTPDSLYGKGVVFRKQSLDIDLTSILLKYRPSVQGSPAQLNTDLNISVYAGWRFDNYRVKAKRDPLGRTHRKTSDFAYDFGIFAGPGTTLVSPFTTANARGDEYNAMTFQYGLAGFLETNMASFGLSVGYDHLLSPDRKVWIYQKKPWIGFIVGIALR